MAILRVSSRGSAAPIELYPRLGDTEASTRYRGETYYGLPAIKPSPYRWLITAYFFIGGLASAAQFIATAVDLFGSRRDRSVVRTGRYLALAGAALSPILLIADLHTPRRWYNMLRIYRRTSPMSIGTWALVTFGTLSGLVASGQLVEDTLHWRIGQWVARVSSLPAAVAGGLVALYTGTLLAATNIPLWASGFPFLSSLFASSAASTATAALTLAADATGASEETRTRLSAFGLCASSAELLFAGLIGRHWRSYRMAAPLSRPPLNVAWRLGVLGGGILSPLLVHAVHVGRKRAPRRVTTFAAITTLVGGFLLRAVFIFGGARSAERPQDYFRFTQSA